VQELVDKLWSQGRDLLANVVLIDQVDSTHSMALRLIDQMDEEGMPLEPTLLLALSQLHGRGRGAHHWLSPPGGLYLNWIASGMEPAQVAQLPVLAAAAAHQAIVQLGIDTLVIKWPNDLLVEQRKLAGLLIHARQAATSWATVGLGVNLAAAPEIGPEDGLAATSVRACLGEAELELMLPELTISFITLLHEHLQHLPAAAHYWHDHLLHREGDELTIRLGTGELTQGTCAGFTEEGFLRLLTAEGERTITSGELLLCPVDG